MNVANWKLDGRVGPDKDKEQCLAAILDPANYPNQADKESFVPRLEEWGSISNVQDRSLYYS